LSSLAGQPAGGWLAAMHPAGVVGGSQNRSRLAAAVQTRLAADDRLHAWSEGVVGGSQNRSRLAVGGSQHAVLGQACSSQCLPVRVSYYRY
jgi:hypothetical protein